MNKIKAFLLTRSFELDLVCFITFHTAIVVTIKKVSKTLANFNSLVWLQTKALKK